MENVNNSIEKPENRENSSREIVDREKEYNSEVDSQEKPGHTILKGTVWLGVIAVVLAGILWVLHNWLGYLTVSIEKKWDFADSQCKWLNKNLSLWLVGKGMLRVPEKEYWHFDRHNEYRLEQDTFEFCLKYSRDSNDTIRTNAFSSLFYIIKGNKELKKDKRFIPLVIENLEDEVPIIRQNAAFTLRFYGDISVVPYLKRALKKEKNGGARHQIKKAIRILEYRHENNLKLPLW